MQWAAKFAVRTMVMGLGLVGTLAGLTGKDHGGLEDKVLEHAQSIAMSTIATPDRLCSFAGKSAADAKSCACVADAIKSKPQAELLAILQSPDADPQKQAFIASMREQCGAAG